MTVVLAVRCADGVVMGSDSQVTEADRGMTYPAQKLHELGPDAAWGGSGARPVLWDVERCFDAEADQIVSARDVGREIQERVLPILRHHYDNFIEVVPGEGTDGTPSAYVLAAGFSHGEPFIVQINPNGMISRYEEIGFHAVGSGAPMAQQAGALLEHFQIAERRVDYGVVAVLRVLDALAASSPSVGGPLDVCRITPEGGAQHLTEDEIAEVREKVAEWERLEQAALDDLFDGRETASGRTPAKRATAEKTAKKATAKKATAKKATAKKR